MKMGKNENINDNHGTSVVSGEIDLVDLLRKLWQGRRLIMWWCLAGVVVGLVIGFSIPKEYTTVVKLAPEIQNNQSSALKGLGAVASMAGVNLSNATSADAVSPELYPDIVQSVPFMTELFDVMISDQSGYHTMNVAHYVSHYLREPWWNDVFAFPFRVLRWGVDHVRPEEDVMRTDADGVDPFCLTDDQNKVLEILKDRIQANVDSKTQVISLSVTMQDPLISATLTDTVMQNLQNYITEYRTNKARHDLEFTQRLFDEAQSNYYEAQQRYAQYMDRNQGLVRRSSQTEQERLANEATLAYELYNQMAQRLQLAKARVQEMTPVYVVLQPASVPLKPSKPSKTLILIGCVFLAGVAAVCWLSFGKEGWREIRQPEQTKE